ncbi:methyltransferase domain-containing protein [Gordonia sp. CPCC 206044]|uniref:methyltransferase domain-containing protein n=1 Tax=Gordonia sp. CPCC 206044 TaxID=3140793 RepID=UPI003AF3C9CD
MRPLAEVNSDIYLPQHDSWLLAEAVRASGLAGGARVADLCTGTGVIARRCADLGAHSVVAIDASPASIAFARIACHDARCPVRVEHGDIGDLVVDHGGLGFDLITCNPPYVPTPGCAIGGADLGPVRAWSAGIDGRGVLDPLCAIVYRLLAPGGTLLLVQSEFAGVPSTMSALTATGLSATVVAQQTIPFGPVLDAHSAWYEQQGLLEPGRRTEELFAIRADKPLRPGTDGGMEVPS